MEIAAEKRELSNKPNRGDGRKEVEEQNTPTLLSKEKTQFGPQTGREIKK